MHIKLLKKYIYFHYQQAIPLALFCVSLQRSTLMAIDILRSPVSAVRFFNGAATRSRCCSSTFRFNFFFS